MPLAPVNALDAIWAIGLIWRTWQTRWVLLVSATLYLLLYLKVLFELHHRCASSSRADGLFDLLRAAFSDNGPPLTRLADFITRRAPNLGIFGDILFLALGWTMSSSGLISVAWPFTLFAFSACGFPFQIFYQGGHYLSQRPALLRDLALIRIT